MALKKITIHSSNVHWPEQCAVCNGAAEKMLAVDTSRLTGVANLGLFLVLTKKVTRIRHPICKKHFWRGWFASGLSQRSLFYLGLGFFSVFFGIAILATIFAVFYRLFGGENNAEAGTFFWFCVVYFIGYWGIFFWAKRNTPVRLLKATDTELVFLFQNQEYAENFSHRNLSTNSQLDVHAPRKSS